MLGHLEHKDLWDLPDRMETQVLLDLLDQRVMWDQLEHQAFKVNRDQMDPPDQMEHPVLEDQ